MIEPPLFDLLDDRRITGPIEIFRHLGPPFQAALVDESNVDDAGAVVSELCSGWGGACHRLYSSKPDANELPLPLLEDLKRSEVDVVAGRGILSDSLKDIRHDISIFPNGGAISEPLLPVLIASTRELDDWGEVEVALLATDDPWYIAYLGVLGVIPETPLSPQALQIFGLRPEVGWHNVINVTREEVAGNAEDLLERLRTPTKTAPTFLSCALLSLWVAARNAGIVFDESQSATPGIDRSLVGPNICVVYEPGSVRDLALLWNLRAAHGLPRRFPLAAPLEQAATAINFWSESAQARFGIGGDRRPCLISRSIPLAQLESLATSIPGWRAADWAELSQVGDRPGRMSVELATFRQGRAPVTSWTADDRLVLGLRPQHGRGLNLRCTVAPSMRRLPPSSTLRPEWAHAPGWRDWGYRAEDPGPEQLLSIEWPSGWAVLSARLTDEGLRGQPSTAGRTATTFLRQLGSFDAISMLLDSSVLDELHRLGTARSMSWFRRRVRELSKNAGATEQRLEAIEEQLEEMRMRPPDAEQPDVTVDKLRALFGGKREATATWVRWAEQSGIFVRGVNIRCKHCMRDSWRAVGELTPPIICRGCGRILDDPFPVDQLKFRYRASEPLLRLIESDAFVHLLAMRYFCLIWQPRFGKPANLFGAYPGVDIFDGDTLLGEADVLLVMGDGRLVPVECKQRGVGLNEEEISKLETLSSRLNSPWSVLATADWAEDCPEIWQRSIRRLPEDKMRIVLTAEQLLDQFPFTLNADWELADSGVREKRREQFTSGLGRVVDYLAQDK